jgi:hypothetical protein
MGCKTIKVIITKTEFRIVKPVTGLPLVQRTCLYQAPCFTGLTPYLPMTGDNILFSNDAFGRTTGIPFSTTWLLG